MRNASLWRALLGVDKTVVEDIEFDPDEKVLVATCGRNSMRPGVAVGVGDGPGAMTVARADGGGGAWTWARSRSG